EFLSQRRTIGVLGERHSESLAPALSADVGQRNAEPCQQSLGGGVAFGVDPSRVERILASVDFQEARRLDKGWFAESFYFAKGLARWERAMLGAVLENPPRYKLIESRYVAQQRGTRRIDVDPHEAHAEPHGFVECVAQVGRLGVVLIEADANTRR